MTVIGGQVSLVFLFAIPETDARAYMHLISAVIIILYGIGVKYGLDNLAIRTVMAGVFLLVMGLARLRDDQKAA